MGGQIEGACDGIHALSCQTVGSIHGQVVSEEPVLDVPDVESHVVSLGAVGTTFELPRVRA